MSRFGVKVLSQTHSADVEKVRTASAQLTKGKVAPASPQRGISPELILTRLSYSHIELIADLDDPFKRAFYEIECIRGNWSVRTLRRQIASLYFERSGLSTNKEKLAALTHSGAEQAEPKLAIRDPYIFEFLGLKPQEAVNESDLEDSLLDNLQEFLLELGLGFLFRSAAEEHRHRQDARLCRPSLLPPRPQVPSAH